MKKKLITLLTTAAMAAQFAALPVKAEKLGYGSHVVTDEKYSGNAAGFYSWGGGSNYLLNHKYIGVKPNTRYRYSLYAKAKRASGTFMSVSWGTRLSIPSLGNTSDWQYYELYWDSGEKTQAEVQLVLDGATEGLWVDDVAFYELDDDGNPVGDNLYPNPGFEDGVTVAAPEPEKTDEGVIGTEAVELHSKLMEQDVIDINEFDSVMSLEKHIPAQFTENRVIDADAGKWENTPGFLLPIEESHYYPLSGAVYGGEEDLSAGFKFSYDYNYLYVLAEVKDNVHEYNNDASYYWQNDSLQITFGQNTSAYGYEFGFMYDEENNKVSSFSSSVAADKLARIKTAGKKDGNVVTYEIAIPWEITFERFNDSVPLLACAIVNDSDNGARKQALQMAPGIIEGKTNAKFHVLDLLGEEADWYAWNSGELNVYVGEEEKYSTMIANRGEDKTFTVKTPDGAENTLTVAKNTIAKVDWTVTPDKNGVINYDSEVILDGKSSIIPLEVSASRVPRTEEEIEAARQKFINEYLPELKAMMEECEKQNIPMDYETVNYATIERFVTYAKEDVEHGKIDRANYVIDCLEDLYEQAKTDMQGYLDGTKKYHVSQRFVTGRPQIDGTTVWANMRNSQTGEITRRPLMGTGYGNFGQATADIPNFEDFGTVSIQNERGPLHVFYSKDYVANWSILNSGLKCEFVQTTEEKKSGKASLKFTSSDTKAANKYKYLYQSYSVKPNTTYKYGLSAKTENAGRMWFSVDGWNTGRMDFSGSYDWQNFEYEYTTGANQTSMTFFLFFEDKADVAYIDDLFVKEVGTDKNLIKNGGFEYGVDLEYIEEIEAKYDPSAFYDVVDALQRAEENNVTYCMLTSFHYISFLANQEDVSAATGHFMPYNISSERLRTICRIYLGKLIPMIKDYQSLDSICLLNEPAYCVDNDIFLPDYREFLKERYTTIEAVNARYGTKYKTFDEITYDDLKMGSKDPWVNFGLDLSEQEKRPQFYDFIQFNDQIVGEFFIFLSETVHELAPEIPVHFKTLGDYFGLDSNYNREGIRRGVNYEIINDYTDYNGCDNHAYVDDSDGVNILTKMRAYDYMTSLKDAPVYNTEDHIIRDSNDDYIPEQAKHWCTNAWEAALHGGTMNVSWVWQRDWANGALMGSVLERPDIVAKYGRTSLDMNRLGFEIDTITNRDAHIAVLDSEGARLESKSFVNTSFNAWKAGIMSGHKVQFVTEKMMAEGKLSEYEIILVPELSRIKEDALSAVESRLNNGAKMIILGEESFKRNEYGDAYDEARIKAIYDKCEVYPIETAGTKLMTPTHYDLRDIVFKAAGDLGLNKVEIVDSVTGELVKDVEWAYAEYNGDMVISVTNFDWNSVKDISVVVNGVKAASFEEMREEKVYEGTYKLLPNEPIMIKVDL